MEEERESKDEQSSTDGNNELQRYAVSDHVGGEFLWLLRRSKIEMHGVLLQAVLSRYD
jgi:hypothetical protein